MEMMAAGAPTNPFWVAVGGVALLTLIVGLIQRGNRKQRPILWAAFFLIAVMVLFPPWLGEKGSWIDMSQKPGHVDPHYVISRTSMGYSFILLPPRRTSANTNRPMAIHWSRLAAQIGAVALVTGGPVFALRRRRGPCAPVDAAARGGQDR